MLTCKGLFHANTGTLPQFLTDTGTCILPQLLTAKFLKYRSTVLIVVNLGTLFTG